MLKDLQLPFHHNPSLNCKKGIKVTEGRHYLEFGHIFFFFNVNALADYFGKNLEEDPSWKKHNEKSSSNFSHLPPSLLAS